MEGADQLLTVAEIGAAFAGVAGIVWIVSSALMAAFIVVHISVVLQVTQPLRSRGEWLPGPVTGVVFINFAAVCVVQALNALGLGFERSYAAYFLGLLLFLLIASINFIFLMRVVWSGEET